MAICRLRQQNTEFETHLIEEAWDSLLLRRVDNRSLNAAICHQPDNANMDGKTALPLFQGRRFLCVRADHPEANNLTLKAMAKYPFSCPGGELGIGYEVKRFFSTLDIDFPPTQMIVSNSLAAAKEIVMNSDAFAIFTDLSVLRESQSGTIKLAEIHETATPYWYYLIVRDDHIVTELFADFMSVLGKMCRELGIKVHPDAGRIKTGKSLRR
jgi:DNA-binding transcriptional LysR family regulator